MNISKIPPWIILDTHVTTQYPDSSYSYDCILRREEIPLICQEIPKYPLNRYGDSLTYCPMRIRITLVGF